MGRDAMILVFWMLSFKPTFSLFSFTFIKRFLVPLHFLPWGWYHLNIWGYWYFSWQSWFQLVPLPAQGFSWCTSVLGVHWKDWCWSWNSSTLVTSCKELTHWKRPWCWEGLGAGGEGDDRGWDGWMASPTQWAWVWVNSGSWWWTGRPGVLRFMGSQRVRHN